MTLFWLLSQPVCGVFTAVVCVICARVHVQVHVVRGAPPCKAKLRACVVAHSTEVPPLAPPARPPTRTAVCRLPRLTTLSSPVPTFTPATPRALFTPSPAALPHRALSRVHPGTTQARHKAVVDTAKMAGDFTWYAAGLMWGSDEFVAKQALADPADNPFVDGEGCVTFQCTFEVVPSDAAYV